MPYLDEINKAVKKEIIPKVIGHIFTDSPFLRWLRQHRLGKANACYNVARGYGYKGWHSQTAARRSMEKEF